MSGIMVMSCAPQQKKLVYPETAKVDTVDVYFGTQVPDPYRWLENAEFNLQMQQNSD